MGPYGSVASRDLVTQALPVLLLTAVGGTVAGSVLAGMGEALRAMPALIVVAPALISLRGTISGAVGARLGSAAHMGLLDGEGRWDEVWENVAAGLALSLVVSAAAALFAYGVTAGLGLPAGELAPLVAVSVAAGFGGGIVLAGITVATVLLAYRHGLDPDNVTSPTLATLGDIVTLALLFVFASAARAMGVVG